MTQPPLDNLESRLREAMTWRGPTTQLWKRALASQPSPSNLSFDVVAFAKRRWFPLVGATAAACLSIVIFASSSVQYESTGSGVNYSVFSPAPASRAPVADAAKHATNEKSLSYSYQSPSVSSPIAESEPTFPVMADTIPYVKGQVASPVANTRHVIHKATIELITPDVRAAFLKAGLILNEGLGEHVQDSSLTGSGETASANLTLRVVASRLSDVCNALRELGVVVSERREGQDVTGQVVDIEARLRNEQRVETELLALFDQRKDAPLKDVLDLRQKLSEVRAGIEQLVAQRDHLSRLVSLATVLVIIRTGEKPAKEPKDEGLWHYFAESIQHAWRSGLRGLADTIASLLGIFIGGLIWWILLAVALLLLRRFVKARSAKS